MLRLIRKIVLFQTLSVFFFAAIATAGACGVVGFNANNGLDLKQVAEKIEKQTQIDLVKKDPTKFCESNMLARFINANPKDAESTQFRCEGMSIAELKKQADSLIDFQKPKDSSAPPSGNSWNFSLIPTEKNQKYAYMYGQHFYTAFGKNFTGTIDSEYEEAIKDNINLTKMKKQNVFSKEIAQKIKTIFSPVEKSKIQESTLIHAKICSDMNLMEVIGCTKAVGRVMQIASPAKVANNAALFMPVAVWQKVILSEDKYSEGLRLAALKMSEKVKEKNGGSTDVFTDLKNSFIQSGMATNDSQTAALEVLALYGNASGNLGSRIEAIGNALIPPTNPMFGGQNKCSQTTPNICGYLAIISQAIPALDFITSQQGKTPYSFPANVEAKCNTNKSYHFWMTAYLSNQLVSEGFSKEEATLAPYISSVGYQFNRELGYQSSKTGPGKEALQKTAYDPVTNIIRADLAYASAGAEYGASYSSNQKSKISVDKKLGQLLEASKETVSDYTKTNISALDQLGKYQRFTEVVAPKAALYP